MSDPMHQQLLGHLLGVLDDDEQEQLDAQLSRDARYYSELVQWRRRLAPLEAMRPDYEPRPGLAERTCRFVAARASVTAGSPYWGPRRRMSPCPVPPSHNTGVRWLDLTAVALLLVTMGALMIPAIYGSRFQSRLVLCQDGLRQFGLALAEYSYDHSGTLSRLASDGELTDAGVFAVERLNNEYFTNSHRPLCPDNWLAAQNAMRGARDGGVHVANLKSLGTLFQGREIAVPDVLVSQSVEPQSQYVRYPGDDWPGMWRDGTTDGSRRIPSRAGLPLLADAPSADLPGQDLPSHDGRGRNVLFDDGRVDFLPCAAPRDAVDTLLAHSKALSAADISAPIIFVNGR